MSEMVECPECGNEYQGKRGLSSHRSSAHSLPYEDEEWLREKYVDEGMTAYEIGEECGTSNVPIINALEKFGIEKRTSGDYRGGRYEDWPWRDEDKLRELYLDRGMSAGEAADELGCAKQTVWRWLENFGIETRDTSVGERVERAHFKTEESGYEVARAVVGDSTKKVRIHRLIAVAEYGVEAVKDRVVHHKKPIPWLNIHDNLEVMTQSEHARLHNLKRSGVVADD